MWTAWERDNAGGSLGWRINLSQTIHHSLPSPPPTPTKTAPLPRSSSKRVHSTPIKNNYTLFSSSSTCPSNVFTLHSTSTRLSSMYLPPQCVHPTHRHTPPPCPSDLFIHFHPHPTLPPVRQTCTLHPSSFIRHISSSLLQLTFLPAPHPRSSIKHVHTTPACSLIHVQLSHQTCTCSACSLIQYSTVPSSDRTED